MDPTWPRLIFAVDVTDATGETHRYHWQQIISPDVLDAMPRWIGGLRSQFDDEWPRLMRKTGRSLYGTRIGPRLACVRSLVDTAPLRPDGDWLLERFMPKPTPMDIMSRDLNRVLADKAWAERHRPEGIE